MGLFSKIINALAGSTRAPISKRSSTASTNNQDQELSGWLSVKAAGKDWFCQTAISPNGRFTLAWADQSAAGGSGYRTSGNGRYFLFASGKKVLEGELQRPNDGHVADNGTFILADWLFGDGLKSKLFVFNADGALLVEQHFKANLYNTGLSANGKFSVCQTANADSGDGDILSMFDLSDGSVSGRFSPESGWAKDYRFDEEKQIIFLVYEQNRFFGYTFTGDFIDRERWLVERVDFASPYQLVDIAVEQLSSTQAISPDEYLHIDQLLTKALAGELSDSYRARAYRYQGEIQHALGNDAKAIEYLKQALALNPKVGAKRLLTKLRD